MLIFQRSDCKETINSADDESVKQIFDRLDEHVRKCPLATFTFEGKTDVAGRELTIYDQSLSALRVGFGHTDDAKKQPQRFKFSVEFG